MCMTNKASDTILNLNGMLLTEHRQKGLSYSFDAAKKIGQLKCGDKVLREWGRNSPIYPTLNSVKEAADEEILQRGL